MNKKNYIDKIELILNTSGKYITRKEKDMILDYVNYFKTKNNVIEEKNIELVIEIERLNNKVDELMELYTTERHCKDDYKSIINEVREYIESEDNQTKRGIYPSYWYEVKVKDILEILDKENKWKKN